MRHDMRARALLLAIGCGLLPVPACGGGATGIDAALLMDGAEQRGTDEARGPDAADEAWRLELPDLGPDADVPCCADDQFDERGTDLGKPCALPEDCASGMCLETPGGSVCTIACVEECPADWVCKGVPLFGPDPIFVCVPRYWGVCEECKTAQECGMSDAVCSDVAEADGGTFCSVPCKNAADCPTDFQCADIGGRMGGLCKPVSGSCRCGKDEAGTVEQCSVANAFGVCTGSRECQGLAGWTDCDAQTPAVEVCNGLDDNCDGDVDEEFPLLGQACDSEDADSCATGTWTCAADGNTAECVNETAAGIDELCDGLDNDCDGPIDEDFADLGFPCDGGDTDLCANGTWTCEAAGHQLECINETATGIAETCDDLDNDCDDTADEDYPLKGTPCDSADADFCPNGYWTCTPAGSDVECVNESAIDVVEICNYLDDDCDGEVDEGYIPPLGDVCDGQDADLCANGTLTCSQDGLGLECINENPVNIPEVCNGQDDDCNSLVDPEGSQGCTVYYPDKDNDLFGASGVTGKCLCSTSGDYEVTSSNDCYDANASAHPGQTGWFTSPRGDGSFDYDCSGSTTQQWTQIASNCTLSLEVCSGTEGWDASAPACGAPGKWKTNCHWQWWPPGCVFDESNKVQGCH